MTETGQHPSRAAHPAADVENPAPWRQRGGDLQAHLVLRQGQRIVAPPEAAEVVVVAGGEEGENVQRLRQDPHRARHAFVEADPRHAPLVERRRRGFRCSSFAPLRQGCPRLSSTESPPRGHRPGRSPIEPARPSRRDQEEPVPAAGVRSFHISSKRRNRGRAAPKFGERSSPALHGVRLTPTRIGGRRCSRPRGSDIKRGVTRTFHPGNAPWRFPLPVRWSRLQVVTPASAPPEASQRRTA